MAKDEGGEKESVEVRKSEPTSSGGLIPFSDIEQWFDERFPSRWFAPLEKRLLEWPSWFKGFEMRPPFEGRWPKVDVIDRDNEIVVRAELPGVTKENIDISVTDRSVTLRATTQKETKEEKGQYYRREMSRGEFERTIPLATEIDADATKAVLKDGVLELTLPKVKQTPRKTVKIQ